MEALPMAIMVWGGAQHKLQNTRTNLLLQIVKEAVQHTMRENCVGRRSCFSFAGLSGKFSQRKGYLSWTKRGVGISHVHIWEDHSRWVEWWVQKAKRGPLRLLRDDEGRGWRAGASKLDHALVAVHIQDLGVPAIGLSERLKQRSRMLWMSF